MTAAHLVDAVLPRVPYRQWVLSVPKRVRWLLKHESEVVAGLVHFHVRVTDGVVGLELFLNRDFGHRWFVSWSAVALACLLPIVALRLDLRKWLRRRQTENRKLLHAEGDGSKPG